jgi:hypothetical protein
MKKNELLPSDRKFGFLFSLIFLLLTVYFYYKNAQFWLISFLVLCTSSLVLVSIVKPKFLALFNKAWFSLGILMGRFVSPIVLGVIFFLLISPLAIFLRIIGRDELRLKKDSCVSYWINRESSEIDKNSFKKQF